MIANAEIIAVKELQMKPAKLLIHATNHLGAARYSIVSFKSPGRRLPQ